MTGKIQFNLSDTLDSLGITRNRIAVESKVRPATVLDLASGETKRIEIDTLVALLDALNTIAKESDSDKVFGVLDIIEYIPNDNKPAPQMKQSNFF